MIKRGNHKSTISPENTAALNKNYKKKEIKNGWMSPITIKSLQKLKAAAVIPLGLHRNLQLTEIANRS